MAPIRGNLNQEEANFLRHTSMWGSDGYPVRKVSGGKWIWEEMWGVKGAPVCYKTKREAFAAIERYIDVLCDKAACRL
jgi:hypothetical protein